MTGKLIVFFLFTAHVCFSQNQGFLIDKETHQLISNANIILYDGAGKKIKYADNGRFTYPNKPYDSIVISHVRYQKQTFYEDDIPDTIFMVPKTNTLNEVVLSQKDFETELIQNYENRSLFARIFFVSSTYDPPFWSFIYPKYELITFYKPEKDELRRISEVQFKTQLALTPTSELKTEGVYVKLRLNIYNHNWDLIGSQIKSFAVAKISDEETNMVFNIDDKLILPEEGLFFGLQIVSILNGKSKNDKRRDFKWHSLSFMFFESQEPHSYLDDRSDNQAKWISLRKGSLSEEHPYRHWFKDWKTEDGRWGYVCST